MLEGEMALLREECTANGLACGRRRDEGHRLHV